MKKLLILLFSLLITFNSYGAETVSFYANGQKESVKNYNKDGKADGYWNHWFENGQKL